MPKYLASKGSLQQGTASSLAFHLGNMLSGGGEPLCSEHVGTG
jgi:hypothetical protein